MFIEPKGEKRFPPFVLANTYKEAVIEEISHLCAKPAEELDTPLQRAFDFWCLTFGTEFLTRRYPGYIAKIVIESNELIQKLDWDISTNPDSRASAVKAIPFTIISTFSSKNSIGCVFGLQLETDCERMTRKEIKDAIEACGMGFELLDAFYKHHLDKSSADLFYFEIGCQEDEVECPTDLSLFEKTFLQKIETRIQVVVPTLFMQRNREEIVKNLLVLGREICFIEDIPQVMILYDHHTHQDIMFTIVLARVKKRGDLPVLDLLKVNKEDEHAIQEQTCSLRNLSKEHTIEGNIFQIQLKNLSRFQKKNSSIDYNLARKHIVQCLQLSLGEIRDYNGGLFSERDKKLEELKKGFPKLAASCLKSFFYSMQPLEQQIALPIELLALFFNLFQRFFANDRLQILTKTCNVKLIIALKCKTRKQNFGEKEILLKSEISYETVAHSQWFHGDFSFQGFILSFDTLDHLQKYEKELRRKVAQIFSPKSLQEKILRIGVDSKLNRFDFDPRTGGTSEAVMINKLLFEGLTRIDKKEKVVLACAKSYERSLDKKVYTFQLRELCWSNGAPLTADHFEYAWKKLLSPESKTIFDYLLHSILNAKQAKEAKVSLDAMAVKALNSTKLEIRLNHPVPYFLELLAHPIFSPVYPELDRKHPQWSCERSDRLICNGPFRPRTPRPFYRLELEKNPYYWDQEQVRLERILVSNVYPQQALELFKNQQLDWLDASFVTSKQKFMEYSDKIRYLPTSRVFWCCFNIRAFPLSNKKIRQAFFYAVDRQKIIEEMSGNNEPAYSPLPKKLSSFSSTKYVEIENKQKAKQLFVEGLKELGLSRKAFPSITISLCDIEIFCQVGRRFKKQIEEVLGVQCVLLKSDFNETIHKMHTGNYEMSVVRWTGFVNHPLYVLEFFRMRSNGTNLVGWENVQYQSLIKKIQTTENQQQTNKLMAQAEQILIDDCVILPLFYRQDMMLTHFPLEIDHQNQRVGLARLC